MTTITALPVPVPSRTDPVNFPARGDNFLGSLPTFATQMNLVANEINTANAQAAGSASSASSSASSASASASAAATSASTAASNTNATLWISGTTYAANVVVYSPINGRSYKRKTSGAGTTDPSLDTTNWQPIFLDINTSYPKAKPSLVLDFANSGGFIDKRMSFTRSTTGTYIGKDGLIKTAQINEPRIAYDPQTLECTGLLIEDSQTNYMLRSQEFDNAAWNKSNTTISQNTMVAPDGTTTADKLWEAATTGGHSVYQNFSVTSGAVYTASVFVKAIELEWVCIIMGDSLPGVYVYYNVNTLQKGNYNGANTSIKKYPNGWVRISLTGVATTTGTSYFEVITSLTGTEYSHTGNGSGTTGLAIWGAQVENAWQPSSYIPTTSSTITRANDNAGFSGTNFSSWFNQLEGTILVDTYCDALDPSHSILQISDGTNFKEFIIYDQGNDCRLYVVDSGTTASSSRGMTTGLSKSALTYKNTNSFTFTTNGTTTWFSGSLAIPAGLNQMNLGRETGNYYLNGCIKKLVYYPVQISSNELETITKQ